jgi:glycosyltransferase involved in cell wall biosynthesis
MTHKLLSVVIPAFNEEESISEFICEVIEATLKLQPVEILVVDDGSSDSTAAIVEGISKKFDQVKLLRLLTNSGHMAAITAGLQNCKGEWVVTIDADGQDDPKLIPEMLKACLESDSQICFMSRVDRKNDPIRHRFFSPIFYKLLSGSMKGSTPYQAADFRLMSSRVVNVLNHLPETNRVYRVIVPALGFSSTTLKYHRRRRSKGSSKYGFLQLATLGFRSMLATTGAPLRWVSLTSIFFAIISLAIASFSFALGVTGESLPGWASLALVISTLFFFQSLATLVICEFLLILLADIRKRPTYQVKDQSWN